MIIGAEIGLLVYGIYVMIVGKATVAGGRVVEGVPARIAALFAILPLPTAIAIAFVIGYSQAAKGKDLREYQGMLMLIEIGCLLLGIVLFAVVANLNARLPKRKRVGKKTAVRRRRVDEFEDYDDA